MTDNPLQNIRENAIQQQEAVRKDQFRRAQLEQAESLENTLFTSFKALVNVLEGQNSKAEAIGLIVDNLDKLGKENKDNATEVATIRSGLETLEKELKEIPTNSLKQLPKFLQQKDKIQVTNLAEVSKYFTRLEQVIKSKKMVVEAPNVTVKPTDVTVEAPIVNVPELDVSPIKDAVLQVIDGFKRLPDQIEGALPVFNTNSFITERFDEWKVQYDTFDEDSEPTIQSIKYFLNKKVVATVKFTYDEDGNLLSGKKI